MTTPLVICNPRAGGGRAARLWPAIETGLRSLLGPIEARHPATAEATAAAAAEATRHGRALVLVGGDGTLNAAVNGIGPLLDAGLPPPPLALVSAGSGGDFCRTLGLAPQDLASPRALAAGRLAAVDLGCIDLQDGRGTPRRRWFLSVANAGLSARVVQAMECSRLPRLVGPRLAYVPLVLRELARERGSRLELRPEDTPPLATTALIVSVANGRHFGAGMCIAPGARVDDGLFDVVVIRRDRSIRPWDLRHLYSGRLLSHPAVSHFRTRALTLASGDAPLPVDADGELLGHLPARLSCLPGALRIALSAAP